MKKLLSQILLIIGVFCIASGIYLILLRYSPKTLTFENAVFAESTTHATIPKLLIIKSANISLPVIPSSTHNNTWDITFDGVSFLTSSVKPGTPGNSVFYGHNWENLLGNLHTVKPGDTVEIIMSDKKRMKFTVEYTAVVTPDKTEVIKNTNDTRITIYTCIGFLDSKRFVVVAKPIK